MSFGDDFDDRTGRGMDLDLHYWFWVFRRRFWLFALVAGLLSAGGLGVALILPPTYEARASLLVESQQIPTDLVRSTVNASAVEQIEVIKQRLLTRETLLELAERHSVFPPNDEMKPGERVWRMQQAISLEHRVLGGAGRSDTVSTAFSVAFRADSGAKAVAVVNDLVTRILRQSAELRKTRAETTADYFRQEVERLGEELSRMEMRIVAFQEENKGALPESLEYRRSQLDLLQERLQRFELQQIELQQESETLQAALGEQAAADRTPVTETERELAELRREFARRSAILTENHPEIRSLTRRIAALERVAEVEALAGAAAGADPARPPEADPAVREVRRRLSLVDARLSFNGELIEEIRTQRDDLETSLQATPNIQMELSALKRAYEMLETRYSTALGKLAEAEAGEQLEDKQQGERFEVVEQAAIPEGPVAPNRKKYAVMSAGVGAAAGFGLIVLLEILSGVVRRPEDLVRIGREPAAVIPYIVTAGERRWTWALRILSALAVLGAGAAALWALHIHYLPLETIGEKMLEKSGLEGALDLVRRRLDP